MEVMGTAGTVVMEGMAAVATVVVDTAAEATAAAAVAVAIDLADRTSRMLSWAGCGAPLALRRPPCSSTLSAVLSRNPTPSVLHQRHVGRVP